MHLFGSKSVQCVLVTLGLCAAATSQTPLQPSTQELKAPDAAISDDLGWSVAIEGDVIVGGATLDDDQGSEAGTVRVWRRSGSTWAYDAKITAADGSSGNHFGHSVGLDGNSLIVGAQLADFAGADSGAAYVFAWNGSAWTQTARLLAADAQPEDAFGQAVSVQGVRAVVGAHGEDDNANGGCCANESGAAYIFRNLGFGWVQEAKLKADDAQPSDWFGYSADIDGDVAVVGARFSDAGDEGAAYVFRRNAVTGDWTQDAKLVNGTATANFGISVAVSEDVIVVGAEFDDSIGSDQGAAFVYRYDGGSWQFEKKLVASNGQPADSFGVSVDVDDDLIVVGAYRNDAFGPGAGSGYVYRWTGLDWYEERILKTGDGSVAALAHAVAISGTNAVAGAYLDDDLATDSGSVYVFPAVCAWLDADHALPGAAGEPRLWGEGTLQPGSSMALHLRQATPVLAFSSLVVGASAITAPFKGGILVPHPDLLIVGLPVVGGTLDLFSTWPTGVPSGMSLWLQFWIPDLAAAHGLAASNATMATAP